MNLDMDTVIPLTVRDLFEAMDQGYFQGAEFAIDLAEDKLGLKHEDCENLKAIVARCMMAVGEESFSKLLKEKFGEPNDGI